MRQSLNANSPIILRFQSTHPSWGATETELNRSKSLEFQSTHPSWGATMVFKRHICYSRYFNPRTHRGVRHCRLKRMSDGALFISIHAPIVGCDVGDNDDRRKKRNFNPRTHRGVRLELLENNGFNIDISIHAPIVGCDSKNSKIPT